MLLNLPRLQSGSNGLALRRKSRTVFPKLPYYCWNWQKKKLTKTRKNCHYCLLRTVKKTRRSLPKTGTNLQKKRPKTVMKKPNCSPKIGKRSPKKMH